MSKVIGHYNWLGIKRIIEALGEVGEFSAADLTALTEHPIYEDELVEIKEALVSEAWLSEQTRGSGKTVLSLAEKGQELLSAIRTYPDVNPYFEETFAATVTDEGLKEELEFVHPFFEDWSGNFLHPFAHDLYDGRRLENSIFYCYLASQTMVFDWLCHSLLFGAYDVVLRELRTILEGLFPAYYIDTTYPERSLEEKLNILTKLEANGVTHGRRAFAMSGIDNWEEHYFLYRELCSWVHPSRSVTGAQIDQIAQGRYAEMLEVSFKRETFLECVEVWRRVARLATSLACSLLKSLGLEVFQTPCQFFGPVT